jgi:rubrerythrin
LLYRYILKVHNELHVSFDVMKKILKSMKIESLPSKFCCIKCNVDIVDIPDFIKCPMCDEYTHTRCLINDYCGNYCAKITPRPKLIIRT